jgi:hypothetical protein
MKAIMFIFFLKEERLKIKNNQVLIPRTVVV